jgi:hypothetical protein
MLLSIAIFEIKKRLRMISTWIYFLVFFAIGALYAAAALGLFAGGSVSFGSGSKVYPNSPYSLELLIALSGHFGLLVTAAVMARATFQDVESGMMAFFASAPISKLQYLGGRFLGSLVFLMGLYSSIGLGAFTLFHLGLGDPTRLGPERLIGYFQPYLIILLPNVFLLGAGFFALAALTKRMVAVYVGAVVFFVGYLVSVNLAGNLDNRFIGSLLDPFGLVATEEVTRYWSVAERNTSLVPLTGALLWNRLLWSLLGVAFLVTTYLRFGVEKSASAAVRPTAALREPIAIPLKRPHVEPDFAGQSRWTLLVSLSRLEIKESIKNVYFGVILLAGVLFVLVMGSDLGSDSEAKTYPVTRAMVEGVGGLFWIFVMILLTFLSGEIVHRERDAKMNLIYDALPVPTPVVFAAKLAAILLIPVLLVTTVLLCGLGIQTARGYYHYELGLYFKYLFGYQLIRYWIFALLALFVHTVVNHKYLGHLVLVLYTLLALALPGLGLEHHLFLYGSSPRIVLSQMNGFGHFAKPAALYLGTWLACGALLTFIASGAYVRGLDTAPRVRFELWKSRAGRPLKVGIALTGALFLGGAGDILYNTLWLNHYQTSHTTEVQKSEYEKQYKKLEAEPQPRIVKLVDAVDIYPAQRSADIRGTYTLENKTERAIDTLYISLQEDANVRALEVEGGSTIAAWDKRQGLQTRRLNKPMAPGEKRALTFELNYAHPGFVDGAPDNHFAENGTFFDSDYFPRLGYVSENELSADETRKKYGLQPKRPRDLDDPAGRTMNYISHDADFIEIDSTVSTSADQTAITSGYLERTWTEGDRRYFHYTMSSKILSFFSFLSARYARLDDHWNDVAIEIDYFPEHTYDLDRMVKSIKASLDYFTVNFGPYQHKLVRIVEFPRYASFAQSFPNTIPYSEAIGFIARVEDKPDAIDFPFYVTAHEVAHQWWGHQVVSGDLQGATILSETLAQYSALMVMKRTYGPLAMKKFLSLELDQYLMGRGNETRHEMPLERVENQGYIHYSKGSLAMYTLADAIGEDAVNRALRKVIVDWQYKGPPYPTSRALVDALAAETKGEDAHLIEDLFKTITLFENHAVSAKKTKRADGGWDVHLMATSKKLRADEQGNETKVPSSDMMDVGVLDEKGLLIHLERVRVTGEDVDVTMIVNEGNPIKAGLDPRSELVDRLPDDNVIKVEE